MFSHIATIKYYDQVEQTDGYLILRSGDLGTAIGFILEGNGDLDALLDRKTMLKLIQALNLSTQRHNPNDSRSVSPFADIATIVFHEMGDNVDGSIAVRSSSTLVSISVVLEDDDDIEMFLDRSAVAKFVEALETTV